MIYGISSSLVLTANLKLQTVWPELWKFYTIRLKIFNLKSIKSVFFHNNFRFLTQFWPFSQKIQQFKKMLWSHFLWYCDDVTTRYLKESHNQFLSLVLIKRIKALFILFAFTFRPKQGDWSTVSFSRLGPKGKELQTC